MSKIISNYNLQTLNTEELYQHFRATIDFGGNVFVVGQRGTGKTSIAKQAILDSKLIKIEWSMSTFERVDLAGYPRLLNPEDKNYIQYLLPHFFQPILEGNNKVVLILDEVDKADFSILAPLLDVLQFRVVNGRPLKNLQAILMTGNLLVEGGKRPEPTLLDRTEKYLLESDFQHWKNWAVGEGKIHPAILGFLHDYQAELIGDLDQGQNYADKSPRGWENASKITKFGEEKGWSADLITSKVAGCVGRETGILYYTYYTHYQVLLPLAEKISKGEGIKEYRKLTPGQQLIIIMLLCHRVGISLSHLKEKESLPQIVKNIGKFLHNVADEEMALLGLRAGVGPNGVFHLEQDNNFSKLLDTASKRIGLIKG